VALFLLRIMNYQAGYMIRLLFHLLGTESFSFRHLRETTTPFIR